VFTTVEPLAGWRRVEPRQRRTAVDFAQQMRWLVDEAYPEAELIRIVVENCNTQNLASPYAAFRLQKRSAWLGSAFWLEYRRPRSAPAV
jgi:hypothetical protein